MPGVKCNPPPVLKQGRVSSHTAWHANSLVAGVAIDTLQPNSYGVRALPRPMHSTSGACHE